MNDEQRDLVRAARVAAAEAREAQQRAAAAGVSPDDTRLYETAGVELADAVLEITDLLTARAGVTVHEDKIHFPRSKTPAVVLPVEFADGATLDGAEDFAYVSGATCVKLTISLMTGPAAVGPAAS